MDTKLTLKPEKSVIGNSSPDSKNEIEISPFVKNMTSGVKLPSDFDYKKEYSDYLSKKYK